MPRFFIDQPPENGVATVVGDDARHIARSLRMAVGENITVCHGGVVYECTIESVGGELVTARVVEARPDDSEPPCRVTLYVAEPKAGKLDLIVQKATELGAARIVPFLSERCVSRPDRDSSDKRLRRLSKIALEAAKQCGRGAVPEICGQMGFAAAVKDAARADVSVFAYEKESSATLKDAIAGKLAVGASVSVVTGPEGGFSPEEAAAAEDAGVMACSLGRRILRCETAPLYILSAIGYEAEL